MARRKIVVQETPEMYQPVLDVRDGGGGITREMRSQPCVRTTSLRLRDRTDYYDGYAHNPNKPISWGWVAQLTGLNELRTLERVFLNKDKTTDVTTHSRRYQQDHEYILTTPGIYEAQTADHDEELRVFFLFDEQGFQRLTRSDVYEMLSPVLGFGEVRSYVASGKWHEAWASARCLERPDEREAALDYVHNALERAQASLPKLTGTPSQIRWAMQIRQRALEAIESWRTEVTDLQSARRTRDDLSALYRRQDAAQEEIHTVLEATYWIQHRDICDSGRELARFLDKRRQKLTAQAASPPTPTT